MRAAKGSAARQHGRYDDGLFAEWDGYAVHGGKYSRKTRHKAKMILKSIINQQQLTAAEARFGFGVESGLARLELMAIIMAMIMVSCVVVTAFGLLPTAQTEIMHLLGFGNTAGTGGGF